MAVTYGFYDSLNHDRLYNAQQMSAIFDGIINDGVFMSVGNQFHTVAGTGMQVIVKSGRAWFDSTWTLNDAEYPLSIDAADVLLTRIDAVVLEVNSEVATRANTIKVVKGTPASTPAKPTLTNTATVHQHALAYVTIAKNTTAITNSMIEIVVGKTETPYVTAILQTTDITDLFKKWESDFQIWFETVKGTLDGDVALNLQNQIDHCVKKADKATDADIEAGTADKWVDANSIKKEIDSRYKIGDIRLVTRTTDINSDYLLCNGEVIYPEKYSEYYNADLAAESASSIVNIYDYNDLPPIYKIKNSQDSTLSSIVVDKATELEKIYIDQYNNNNIFAICKYPVATSATNNSSVYVGVIYKLNDDKTVFNHFYDITNYYYEFLVTNGICIFRYGESGNSLIAVNLRSSDGNVNTGYSYASGSEDGNYGLNPNQMDTLSDDIIVFYRVGSSAIYMYSVVRKQNNIYFYRAEPLYPTYSSFVIGSFGNSGNYILIFGSSDSRSYAGRIYDSAGLRNGKFTTTNISGNINAGSSSSDYFKYKGIPLRLTRFPNGVAMCGRHHITTITGSIPLSYTAYPCNYTHILPVNNKYYLVCVPDSIDHDNNPLKLCIYEVSELTNQALKNRKLIWSSSKTEPFAGYPIDHNDYLYKNKYIKIYTDMILGYSTPTNNNATTFMYLKVK